MLESVARWCYERRRRVLAGWIVAFVVMGVLGAVAAGEYSTDFNTPGSDSKAAHDLLTERFPNRAGDTMTLVYRADRGVNDPAVRQRVEQLLARLVDDGSRNGERQVGKLARGERHRLERRAPQHG
jgi:RND superfamily putative drug exporter